VVEVGSKDQTAPCSSTGAISVPPRPEKRSMCPARTAEAVPTRGEGAGLDDLVER